MGDVHIGALTSVQYAVCVGWGWQHNSKSVCASNRESIGESIFNPSLLKKD